MVNQIDTSPTFTVLQRGTNKGYIQFHFTCSDTFLLTLSFPLVVTPGALESQQLYCIFSLSSPISLYKTIFLVSNA
ncbi:uncharacterized protein VTP21DRAFT_2675 [Calcarisporiella thermophila]|uniref:uncharacterized protein n=1 Tax=Calcarisporiella thermophila TaxID=911321 RepID=UPI0037440E18